MNRISLAICILFSLSAVLFPGFSRAGDSEDNVLFKKGKTVQDYIQNGHVSPDFWKDQPSKLWSDNGKLKPIRSNDLWELIQQIPPKADLTQLDQQADGLEPETAAVVKKLKSLGFKLSGYSSESKVNERFNVWDMTGDMWVERYLIDMKPPVTAYNFLPGSYTAHIDHVEKLDGEIYRFFTSDQINNGRLAGTNILQVSDADLFKGTYREWSATALFNGKAGWNVIVDERELWDFVNWPWIYKWDGKDWVDVSDQYPDYYKTKVLSDLEKIQGDGEFPERDEIVKAFREAAAQGGPAVLRGH